MKQAKLKLLFTMLIFGSIGLFVRAIPFSSAQIALFRGVLGSIFLLVYGLCSKNKLSFRSILPNLKILGLSGVLMGINWIVLFQAYRFTSITNATLFYYLAPVLVMFLAPLLFREPLTKTKVCSILAAILGMVLVSLSSGLSIGSKDFTGILLGFLAALLYASVILLNGYLKDVSGAERSFTQLTIAALFLLPYVLVTEGLPVGPFAPLPIVLMLVVGLIHTGLAYLVYFSVLPVLGSQTVAVYSYMDPVSAILFSALLLGEPLSPLQIGGGLLILGATFVPELLQKREC